MDDKAKGRMKEATGAVTGDEEKKAEGREPSRGRAQQARRPPRRPRGGRLRPRPSRPRRSETSSAVRIKVDCWATSATLSSGR